MRPEQWQEVERVLGEALDLPPEERQAHIASLADREVREEALALLSVPTERADRFENVRVKLPEPLPLLAEGSAVGNYQVIRSLGQGGMGTVYLARDTVNDREVALKILSPRAGKLSRNEHKTLARLSHKNIAALYESGTTEEGLFFIAMEYVKGIPITAFCDERKASLEERLDLFRSACVPVSYAHRNLVAHCDLKPENILVTDEGEVKLLDFGIAKLLPEEDSLATLTRAGERPFTLAFASPEQLQGDPTNTPTDIYSLGVLLSLLLTEKLPYQVESSHDLSRAIRNGEIVRPSLLVPRESDPLEKRGLGKRRRRLEGDLDTIVLRALRREPEKRYPSVDELSEDVRRYFDHEPVRARKGSRRYRAAKFFERHRIASLSAAALLLLLISFTLTLVLERRATLAERDRARKEAARAEAVSGFLVGMFQVPGSSPIRGRTITAREILDGAFLKLSAAPPEEPQARGTLLYSLGKIHFNLGLYAPAESLLEPSLRDLERDPTRNRTQIAETLADLATVRYVHGRYGEAEHYALRALSVGEGAEEESVLSLLGHLAFARGEYEKAERLFAEVERRASVENQGDLIRARAENDHGASLHAGGKYAEALRFYEFSLATRKRLLGESHPEVLETEQNLACLLRDRGESKAALDLFFRVRMGYRALGALNEFALSPLFHNSGGTETSEGKFREADVSLADALALERRLLPDLHPDIARTLAEFGRLNLERGKSLEAEGFLRESLVRLDKTLDPNHPDRVIAENNLAVLLSQSDREEEARETWRKLLLQLSLCPVPPGVDRVIRENATLSLHHGRKTLYRTIPLEMLILSTPSPLPERASRERPSPVHSMVVRFFDDFKDGVIDTCKWEYSGSVVRERNGEFQVLCTITDHCGGARTRPFEIDPERALTITRRVKLHPGNNFFDGLMSITPTGYPEKRFGVSYANYHYRGAGEDVTVGFSLFRSDANSHRFAARKTDASPLIPPVWNRWFDEKLVFDPRTGEVRYFLDGTERLVYNVGALPPAATSITLTLSSWGWYTGHEHTVRSLRVEQ